MTMLEEPKKLIGHKEAKNEKVKCCNSQTFEIWV